MEYNNNYYYPRLKEGYNTNAIPQGKTTWDATHDK